MKNLFVALVLLAVFMFIWIELRWRPNNNDNLIVLQDFPEENSLPDTKIGFFLMGTGKYIQLVDQLINSLEKHLCPHKGHIHVHYFIFTDKSDYKPAINQSKRTYSIVQQQQIKWPNSTLLRFDIVLRHQHKYNYSSLDYLYWLDSDMQLVSDVCYDILGDLIATQHPHYPSSESQYPYDTNPKSAAYLEQSNRFHHPYYVGAFYGGKSHEMLKLLQTCLDNIMRDFKDLNGYIAHVHDESHLNRFNLHLFV